MGTGFAPTWLRQVSPPPPPASQNHFNHCGGVQSLLKNDAPEMIFVHCRSHLLQLALVRASSTVMKMERLSVLTKLYALFARSPLRLSILKNTEEAINGLRHKLVQPSR